MIEPRLDGTEGSGVGFGVVMTYLGGAIVAFFFTGIAMLYGVLIHGKK